MQLKPAGQLFTLARHDRFYESFPDILLTESGRLLVVYREADDHIPTETRLVLLSSDDRGERWSRRVLSAQSLALGQGTWNSPRLARLSGGRIALVCDLKPRRAAFFGNYEIYLWWSVDEGETWYGPNPTGCPGIMPDRLLELPDGDLLLGMTLRDPSDRRALPTPPSGLIASQAGDPAADPGHPPTFRRNYQAVYRSTDGGLSWGDPAVVAHQAGLSFAEGSLVRLPDGRLACYLRENSFKGLPTYIAYSDDAGWSWSPPGATPLRGHRPTAGRLQDGRMLVTYRNVGALQEPQPDPFFLFKDGAWQVHPSVPLATLAWIGAGPQGPTQAWLEIEADESRSIPDFGYTGWVQFPDGEVWCVYHQRGAAPRPYIRACRFWPDGSHA